MKIIVGLGNPGSEYEGTRHNLGFLVVDRLATKARSKFRRYAGFRAAAGTVSGSRVLLVEPQTFMNNSGEVVRDVLGNYGGSAADLIVCCDDLHLPFGKIRLRKKGSDGGHNGLSSVIHQVGTGEFVRVRCGIGGEMMPAPGEGFAGYVLAPFTRQENDSLPEFLDRTAACIESIVRDGVESTMNRVY